MIFVKNSRGGREINMINTLSKINLSKIGWEGGGSMSFNILFFLEITPMKISRLELSEDKKVRNC